MGDQLISTADAEATIDMKTITAKTAVYGRIRRTLRPAKREEILGTLAAGRASGIFAFW